MTDIRNLYKSTGNFLNNEVTINGWVRTIRVSKNFGFIEINDGSFFRNLQIVFEDNLGNFEKTAHLNVGSSLCITGRLVESQGSKQPFEIKAQIIKIIGESDPDFPLQKKRHSFEFLRTIAHLRPRSNTFSAVFRLRSLVSYAIHKFLNERGFIYIHTPIITGSDCEGAGEMFRVTTLDPCSPPKDEAGDADFTKDFFGKQTNLTVSGQLQVENFCMAYNKVYTFGPAFRAENSNTARHASEFWMVEPEIAFADIHDDMDLAEEMIKYIINYALENAPEEMEFFNRFIDKGLFDKLKHITDSSFERVEYSEAVEILKKSDRNFEYPVEFGNDLQTEHERYLTEIHFKKPVFVINYPKEIKAFYMRINDDERTVAAMDLLVPGVGEIIGGSQREERPDKLKQRIKERGLRVEDYSWYLDIRKYGGTPHAGFGLGLERVLMYITGMENIRDVIPFPRTPRNADY